MCKFLILTDKNAAPVLVGLNPSGSIVQEYLIKNSDNKWHSGSIISITGINDPVIVLENPSEIFQLYKKSK